LINLGNAHGSLGEYSQQKDLLERVLNINEQHYGKEHPEVAVTLINLGNAHGSLGEYSQQKDLLERALNINEQHYGKEHPEVAVTLYNLGLAYQDTGDCSRAKECVERALNIFVQHRHPYANRAETALHGLAQLPFQGGVVGGSGLSHVFAYYRSPCSFLSPTFFVYVKPFRATSKNIGNLSGQIQISFLLHMI